VEIATPKGYSPFHVLIDSGAEENFVSQRTVVQFGFSALKGPRAAHTVDGQPIRVYGTHHFIVHARDMRGESASSMQRFLATDISGYDMILGIPWLTAVNPDIHWKEGRWFYRTEDPPAV